MDNKAQKMTPNYKKIYYDIIVKKYLDKISLLDSFLKKEKLTELDVIEINQKLFGSNNKENRNLNGKYQSYNLQSISKILEFQRKNNLNNSQLAKHFKISRNSVAKWKKIPTIIMINSTS